MGEIVVKQTISDSDLQEIIFNGSECDYIVFEGYYLTDNQAEKLSEFKGCRLDLSSIQGLTKEQLRRLSNFQGDKIELNDIDIDDEIIEILNSFNDNMIKILNFSVNDKNDIKRIIKCVKNCEKVNLGNIGYININTPDDYINTISNSLGRTTIKYCFNN